MQGYASDSLAILDLEHLALHQVAVVIQQFGIKHTADIAWLARITSSYVGLVIYSVTQIIAIIVHVYIYMLLWQCFAKGLQPLSIFLQGTVLAKNASAADCQEKGGEISKKVRFHR